MQDSETCITCDPCHTPKHSAITYPAQNYHTPDKAKITVDSHSIGDDRNIEINPLSLTGVKAMQANINFPNVQPPANSLAAWIETFVSSIKYTHQLKGELRSQRRR